MRSGSCTGRLVLAFGCATQWDEVRQVLCGDWHGDAGVLNLAEELARWALDVVRTRTWIIGRIIAVDMLCPTLQKLRHNTLEGNLAVRSLAKAVRTSRCPPNPMRWEQSHCSLACSRVIRQGFFSRSPMKLQHAEEFDPTSLCVVRSQPVSGLRRPTTCGETTLGSP